jgi:hypothetical protein
VSVFNPELVMGWLVLTLINGEVAVTRERSRWRWMGITVVLGPLATFVLVFLPDPASSEP